MKTLRENGWLIETGPNSALETTPLFKELFDELHIIDERVYANESASKRFIVRHGRLLPLPMSAVAFLSSRLWTIGGKLRLLKEPFIGKAYTEETIAQFVTRRLGKEFLDYAINPFVAGVYAGSPEKLSVQSAFPKLYSLEAKYGGLIKGAIKSRKERKERKEVAKDRAKLFSFTNGMQTFPKALASLLGQNIRFNVSVENIIPMRAGKFPIYTISYQQNGLRSTMEADGVVLSTPAQATAAIIRPIDPAMAARLESIYYPPVAEVFLGFKQEQFKQPLDGFGFLVPEVEKRNILGCIWSSTLFTNRAPQGCIGLTSFVGGSRQPELVSNDNNLLIDLVMTDIRSLMAIEGDPIYSKVIRWERAIPQYNLGYHTVLQAMERFEQNFRGAFICSNHRGGIAVGDCLMSAEKTARRIIEMFSHNNDK